MCGDCHVSDGGTLEPTDAKFAVPLLQLRPPPSVGVILRASADAHIHGEKTSRTHPVDPRRSLPYLLPLCDRRTHQDTKSLASTVLKRPLGNSNATLGLSLRSATRNTLSTSTTSVPALWQHLPLTSNAQATSSRRTRKARDTT